MILPFRETWFLMIFMTFFVTSFGIDFWWVWHCFWFHFGTPLASNSMFWGDWFLDDFSISFLMQNSSENGLGELMTIQSLRFLFNTLFQDRLLYAFGSPLVSFWAPFGFYLTHFGSLLALFDSLFCFLWIPFGSLLKHLQTTARDTLVERILYSKGTCGLLQTATSIRFVWCCWFVFVLMIVELRSMFVTLGSYQSGHLAVDDSDLSFPSWSRSLPLIIFANLVYTLFGRAQCFYSCTAKSYCVI